MRTKPWPFIITLLFVSMICVSFAGAQTQINFHSNLEAKELASKLLSLLSDEEIVAQVFMIGYQGTEPSSVVIDWIKKRSLGGIKIFGWNTDNTEVLVKSIAQMQEASQETKYKIPLFIATDQEGGWIRHVKGLTSQTPGNMALGSSGIPYDSYLSGKYIGRELAALGINMNFAPTVDIATNLDSQIIGPRAFSENPMTSALLGSAFVKGLDEAGVVATAKHFPGHGATNDDSHGTLPIINASWETIWNRELVPYRMLANEKIPAIMSGHLAYPKVSGNMIPASLSSFFLKTVLRERLKFTGLIITDDLYMTGAIGTAGSFSEAGYLALKAGNDIIMMSRTPELYDEIWTRTLNAYKTDKTFREAIKQSCLKILETKADYLKRKDGAALIPKMEDVKKKVPDPEGKLFFMNQAARGIALVKNELIPYKPKATEKILFVSAFTEFFQEGSRYYEGAGQFRYSYLPLNYALPNEKYQLIEKVKQYDTVIFNLISPASAELLNAIQDLQKKTIVISSLSPVYLRLSPWIKTSLASYSYSSYSFNAAFAVISGSINAYGKLPVTIK